MTKAARMPRFHGAAPDVHDRLAAARVALVGLGSVGLAAALHFARIGIGALTLIDRGTLKAESISTHPIEPSSVGRPKAEHAGDAVRRIAPHTRVTVYQEQFAQLPIEVLLDADVVVLAVDNLQTEIAVDQRCLHLDIPLLQCSVGGNLLVAQVRSFVGRRTTEGRTAEGRTAEGRTAARRTAEGPCIACNYSSAEWQEVAAESRYSCDGSAEATAKSMRPTRSTSTLCSMAGELGVHRTLRYLLGLGTPLADELLEYRGYTDQLVTTPLRRNPECRLAHERWHVVTRDDGPTTVGTVANANHIAAAGTIEVDGTGFVAKAACSCGTWQSVRRFVAPDEKLGSCRRCGGALQRSPFHTQTELPIEPRVHDVAIPAGRAVLVRAGAADGKARATTLLTTRGSET